MALTSSKEVRAFLQSIPFSAEGVLAGRSQIRTLQEEGNIPIFSSMAVQMEGSEIQTLEGKEGGISANRGSGGCIRGGSQEIIGNSAIGGRGGGVSANSGTGGVRPWRFEITTRKFSDRARGGKGFQRIGDVAV